MTPLSLEDLAARVETLERKNRRLKRFGVAFFVLFLLTAGWVSYQSLTGVWNPGTFTQSISLYNGRPFSFGELARLTMGGAIKMEKDHQFVGNIGTHNGVTRMFLANKERKFASLSVSKRGAFLNLQDSTRAVYLGPGLYDDRQLLLELVTKDGRQGIRLGLDGNQQPVFEVIQAGEVSSFLDGSTMTSVSSGAQGQAPVRSIVQE